MVTADYQPFFTTSVAASPSASHTG